jgi:hypothetical protein
VDTARPVADAVVIEGFELGGVGDEMRVVVTRKFTPDVKGAELGESVDSRGVPAVIVARQRKVQPCALGVRSGDEADRVVDQVDGS